MARMRLPTVRAGAALERVVSACLRRGRLVLAVVGALAVIGLGLAFLLDFSGSTGKLIDGDDGSARATADLHQDFGDEPITIRVHGKLTGMLLTRDLATMVGLEGCLGGNIPRRACRRHVDTTRSKAAPARTVGSFMRATGAPSN